MNSDSPPGQLAPEKGKAPAHDSRRSPTKPIDNTDITRWRLGSQSVAWWEVHLYRQRMLNRLGVEAFPMVGTPLWCALPDDHPVKRAAAFDAAQHWALQVETCQEQLAAAAQAISAADDWTAIAKASRGRAEFVAANPWAKRVMDDAGMAKLAATTKTATGATVLGTDAENDSENTALAEGTIELAPTRQVVA
jgi:hypothetical protein